MNNCNDHRLSQNNTKIYLVYHTKCQQGDFQGFTVTGDDQLVHSAFLHPGLSNGMTCIASQATPKVN